MKMPLRNHFALQNIRVLPVLATRCRYWSALGNRRAAHMLMESLRPQQLLVVGFGEATMTTLKRLSGFIRRNKLTGHVIRRRTAYMTGIASFTLCSGIFALPRASSQEIACTLRNAVNSAG